MTDISMAASLIHQKTIPCPNIRGRAWEARESRTRHTASTRCLTKTSPRATSTKRQRGACWTASLTATTPRFLHTAPRDVERRTRSRARRRNRALFSSPCRKCTSALEKWTPKRSRTLRFPIWRFTTRRFAICSRPACPPTSKV